MDKPLVSVVMPCYNKSAYIAESLESICLQSHKNWECICVDDGSTDGTFDILKKWSIKEPRIKLFCQRNAGPSAARNAALNYANGKYIQFLDADDVILPDKIGLQLSDSTVDNDKLFVGYTGYYHSHFDSIENRTTRGHLDAQFDPSNPLLDLAIRWESDFSVPIHAFLFDYRIFDLNHHGIRFDENLPNHVDWDCWLRIFSLDIHLSHIAAELAVYRIVDHAICADKKKMLEGFLKAIDKNSARFGSDPVVHDALVKKRRMVINAYYLSKMKSLVRSIISGYRNF
jgi:glycosyltransferase involved in cell wall biosynthesis